MVYTTKQRDSSLCGQSKNVVIEGSVALYTTKQRERERNWGTLVGSITIERMRGLFVCRQGRPAWLCMHTMQFVVCGLVMCGLPE